MANTFEQRAIRILMLALTSERLVAIELEQIAAELLARAKPTGQRS